MLSKLPMSDAEKKSVANLALQIALPSTLDSLDEKAATSPETFTEENKRLLLDTVLRINPDAVNNAQGPRVRVLSQASPPPEKTPDEKQSGVVCVMDEQGPRVRVLSKASPPEKTPDQIQFEDSFHAFARAISKIDPSASKELGPWEEMQYRRMMSGMSPAEAPAGKDG